MRQLKSFFSLLLLAAFIPGLVVATAASARVTEEWVARYAGGHPVDYPHAIDIDGEGNVYLTGHSPGQGTCKDYVTVKYDANGNELWVSRYNGLGNDDDIPVAMTVDQNGSVYVTGHSQGSGTGRDFATVKYDTNGNQLWVARYNGPGNGNEHPYAIAVDDSGNVYITGYSEDSDSKLDCTTIKYNSAGSQLWVARYKGSCTYSGTSGKALAVDGNSSVYVVARDCGPSGAALSTIKYDNNGNEIWAARYDSPGAGLSSKAVIQVDGLGNVYVGGGTGTGAYFDFATFDFVTVKYDSNGNERWARRYNGPADDFDSVQDLAVDGTGSVYVTGASVGLGTDSDFATIKYDAGGNELWVSRYNGAGNGSDSSVFLTIDGGGEVRVVGYGQASAGDREFVEVKYSTNGSELEVVHYNGPDDLDDRFSGHCLVGDVNGNLYVTGSGGYPEWGTYADYTTIKYNSGGTPLWVARLNGTGEGADSDHAASMTVDDSGNVYVTGTGNGYATVKYSDRGNELWVAHYSGGNGGDHAEDVAVDGNGNVYVTGRSMGVGTGWDYATMKYDSDGNEVWLARYDGPANQDDKARAIALDDQGNVYVTGSSVGSGTSCDYATVKYNANGNQLWVSRYDGSESGYDSPCAIAVVTDGCVYVSGTARSGSYSMTTIKYDSNGDQLWLAQLDNGNAYDMAVDSNGNAYVTGGGTGYISVKYDTNGNELWVAQYTGLNELPDTAQAIAVGGDGNVYVTGKSDVFWDWPSTSDCATVKYDANGNEIWAARYDSNSNSEGTRVAIDYQGNVYVSVYDFDEDNHNVLIMYSPSGMEVWIARYSGPGTDFYPVDLALNGRNVYVTGTSYVPTTKDDYTTVKYVPPFCECAMVPDATVIPRGGTLGFQASVTNNTGGLIKVLFGTTVTRPNGNETGFIWGPLLLGLAPDQTKSGHKTHIIPLTLPLGIYTYNGYTGGYGSIYDECQFDFEVIP